MMMISTMDHRILALLALLGAAPAWAGWTSLGAMPAGQRLANGVEYHNRQGSVSITVLTPAIVRVRFAPGKQFGPVHSFALVPGASRWSAPFRFTSSADTDEIRTADLTVRIARSPFRVTLLDADGRVLAQDTAADGMAFDGRRVRVWQKLDDRMHFFGFGEKTGPLDKRAPRLTGKSLTMWNSDVPGYDDSVDPLYCDIPFFLVLEDGVAHGIFFDNTWRSNFDVGHVSRKYYDFGAQGGDLDYYLIAGPTPRDVLARFADLTGHLPLPPLWVLGYNQSRWSYYPASKVRWIANQFRHRRIPADVIWLDIHYMRGYRVFTWNRRRFPHPRRLLADLSQQHFHVVTILDPGVKDDPRGYAAFASGLRNDAFVKNPDGSLYVGSVWPGPAVFPDFTSATGRDWWRRQTANFASIGLYGLWIDMNEPSIFDVPSGTMPDDVVFHIDGRPVPQAEVHNVFGQQMSRATQAGLLAAHPNRRPFVLTRDTYAGGQRYAAVWTGDNAADWAHLHDGIATLLGMGISGFPFVGNDIGGFIGVGGPDLWTRWVEAATFFPFMRAHAELDAPNKEPWVYGSPWTRYNRRAIERRYRFLPYIYNCFYRASRNGMPMMRALMLQYPQDRATYDLGGEYLFGRDLLVAPVLQPDTRSKSVYLPAGTWYEESTGKAYVGGKRYTIPVPEGRLALFVPEGGILFLAPVMQSTAAWPTAPLTFDIWATQATARTYYEDDGATLDYLHGATFARTVRFAPRADGAVVTLSVATGSYRPRHRDDRIELHFARRPRRVTLNGAPVRAHAIAFDAARATLIVTIPQSARRQTLRVRW